MRIILMTSVAISNSPSAAACLLLPTSVFGTGDIKDREKADADLSDCLDYRYDSAEWYVDRNGEFCGSQAHHDGTNHYVYRKIKDSATNDDIDDLEAKLYDGTATQKDIDRVTEKLGDRVAKVYGWELPEKVYRFAPEKEKIRDEGR